MLQVEEAIQSYRTSNIETSDNELRYRGTPVSICAFLFKFWHIQLKINWT